ncbi:MAG: TonB-dependent receptor [Balneolaceae bacterium]
MKNQNKKDLIPALVSKEQRRQSAFSKLIWSSCLSISISIMIGFFAIVSAQTSSISGQVTDAQTEEALPGSQLELSGLNLVVVADEDGNFEFSDIRSGIYVLKVHSAGYKTRNIELNLSSGESIVQQIGLAGLSTKEQRNANFSSVIDIDQIQEFGDYSVKEALVRVPGIQVSREGDINIRGAGYDAYAVTFNGQRMAGTGLGIRSFDLGSISTDVIRELEVKKVLTPDMDADALAGVINLNTKQAAGERKLSARAGGGLNTQYGSITEPESRFWVNYAERFQDDLSVALTLNYQQQQKGWEELGIDYGLAEVENGPVDVVEEVAPALHDDDRKRFGSSLDLQYDPTDESHYYFRALFTSEDRKQVDHTNSWQANGDWIDQFTTGAEGGLGTHSHNARQQNIDISQSTFQAGGQHFLESLDLSYSAGWSQSIINNHDILFPFELEGYNLSLNWEDRTRPALTPTNQPTTVLDDGSVDRRFMIGQEFERIIEEHAHNEITARIDVNYPFSIGSLKAGTSARLSYKNGEYDENSFEYNRTMRMVSFNMMREPYRNIEVIGGDYRLPWLVETSDARAFFDNQRPVFSGDENLRRFRSEIRTYNTAEHIYAGYGMATFEFGKLEVIGGARVELTNSEFEGNMVDFDEAGEFIQSEETTESENDFRLFPNAQLAYSVTDQSSIRLAYSRTMARPDFFALTPFQRINHMDSTIFRGNPQLDPLTSHNLDAMLEHSFNNIGSISIGAFYKELDNFIVERQQEISGGELNEYQERIFQNGNERATIYGAEVAWQQHLSFLPGFLNHLNVFANYTWSDSEYETDRNNETALPGQSPHVVNAALGYADSRFSAQISYHWTAEFLSHLEDEPRVAPAVNASGEIYMDRFQDGYQDLSVSAEYTLSPYFKVWAIAKNLLQSDSLEYAYDQQLYQTSTFVRSGFDIRMGIRFDL